MQVEKEVLQDILDATHQKNLLLTINLTNLSSLLDLKYVTLNVVEEMLRNRTQERDKLQEELQNMNDEKIDEDVATISTTTTAPTTVSSTTTSPTSDTVTSTTTAPSPFPTKDDAEMLKDLNERNKNMEQTLATNLTIIMILSAVLCLFMIVFMLMCICKLLKEKKKPVVVLPVTTNKNESLPVVALSPIKTSGSSLSRIPSLNHKHLKKAVEQHKTEVCATGVMNVAENSAKAHQNKLGKRKSKAKKDLETRLAKRNLLEKSKKDKKEEVNKLKKQSIKVLPKSLLPSSSISISKEMEVKSIN